MSPSPPPYTAQLRPDWKEIEAIQSASGSYLRDQGMTQDAVQALQMVSTELLENAVKYGHFPTPESVIEYRLRILRDRVTVEVRNPVRETDDHNFKKLDEHIQWIRGFQNAFEAYIEKLKEVSTRQGSSTESGLGLVRIAYEGQSVLDFFVDETNQLSVSAEYSI